ncbi:hypothetical protein ACB092_07G140800 [Castanea dentata]
MTNTSTMEEKMAEMEQRVTLLTKALEDKDVQISTLMNKLEDMITNTIRAQYGGSSTHSLIYSKPYTKRVDNMRMPNGYQLPNTRRTVSMMELTNTKQWKDEPVVDYINRWRSLSLDCKDRLSEISVIEMCIQGMHWGLLISYHGNMKPPVPKEKKERQEIKKNDRNTKSNVKDSMNINPTPAKISTGNVGKVDDPNYCKYHCIISHPIQKCSVLKELIMKLAKERKIDLDVSDVAQSNLATFACGSPSCMSPTTKQGQIPLSSYLSTVDEEEGWTLVTRKRWKKRRVFPLHLITQESRRAQNQIQPQSRRKNDKRKERLRTEMYDDSAQTQKFRSLVTLEEFFPIKFFQNKSAEVVHTVYRCEVDDKKKKGVDHGSSNETLSSLEQLKSQVDKVEPSQSSTSPKEGITQALEEPKIYTPCINTLQQTQECYACSPDLTFTDEDLLLGSKPHNRPLYVSGYAREQKIDRILIDGGSTINILPKMTMRRLGLAMEELSHNRLVIQGFNQGGQHAIDVIHLELIIGELTSNVLFHVIDAKTTYNMLLGRPWIHGNGIVPSTLHQCFKYLQKDDTPNEVLPVEILSMKSKQSEKKHVKFITRKDNPFPKEDPRYGNNRSSESTSNLERAESSTPSNNPPFLRYVPLSHRKNGQSPFAECLQSTMDMRRPPTKPTMKDVAILKENHVMPLTSFTNPLPSKPLNGFVRSSQSLTEHGILPSKRTKEWFNPKAYRLLAKAGYAFSKQGGLGKLILEAIGEKMHGLSKTQGKMRLEGHEIPIPKTEIGYTPESSAQTWINKRRTLQVPNT